MRPLALIVLLIPFLPHAAVRSPVRPNFTGTWVLDTAVLGRQTGWTDAERFVVQTDSTISIRQHNISEMGETRDSILVPTNGHAIPQSLRAGVNLTNSAIWAGDTLVLTTHGTNGARSWDDVRRWTLIDATTLRVDQVVHMNGSKVRDEASVFRRQ